MRERGWLTWGPFRYDEYGAMVWADGAPKDPVRIIDIRAWGYLTGKGHAALGLTNAEAVAIQNDIGNTLVALLNERFSNSSPPEVTNETGGGAREG